MSSHTQGASAPSVFQFRSTEVRTVEKDGMVWFVASDVAKALHYREAYHLTRILDDDERGPHIVRTPSGDQELTVINESGVFHAVLKSRKPEAVPFRKWVTAEVLPAIRKTGRYDAKPELSAPEPKTKKALPGCLTLEQQDAIKALVKSRVEDLPKDKQAGAAIKLWSSIKTKYGCGYKEVPADQFSAVLSLISRVSLDGGQITAGPVPAIYRFPKPKEGDKSPYSDLMMALLQQLQANHNDVSGAMEIWRNLVDRNERIMESLFGIMAELTLCTKPGRGFMDNHITWPAWHQGFIDGRKRALN